MNTVDDIRKLTREVNLKIFIRFIKVIFIFHLIISFVLLNVKVKRNSYYINLYKLIFHLLFG